MEMKRYFRVLQLIFTLIVKVLEQNSRSHPYKTDRYINGYKMGIPNYKIIEYVKLLKNWLTFQKSVTMFYISKLKWNFSSPDYKIFF